MSLLNIFQPQKLQFEPAVDERRLFSAIDTSDGADSEVWDLKEPIDPDALDAFWTAVIKDCQKDPEWFSFVED